MSSLEDWSYSASNTGTGSLFFLDLSTVEYCTIWGSELCIAGLDSSCTLPGSMSDALRARVSALVRFSEAARVRCPILSRSYGMLSYVFDSLLLALSRSNRESLIGYA